MNLKPLCLGFALLTVLACIPGFGGGSSGHTPPDGPSEGIYFGPRGAGYDSSHLILMTFSETQTVPVTVQLNKASSDYTTFDIAVTPVTGVGLRLSSTSATIPPGELYADLTLEITTTAATPLGPHALQVSRKQAGKAEEKSNAINLEILNRLVSMEYEPFGADIQAGTSQDFVLKFLPRGDTSGAIPIRIKQITPGSITATPMNFSVTLTKHATTPVERVVRLTLPAAADEYTNGLFQVTLDERLVETVKFDILKAGGGGEGFTISAVPLEVTSPLMTSSEEVTFTITPVGGFSGPVRVSYEPSDAVSPQPNTNNFIVNVAPGTPSTFKRRFYWYKEDWYEQVGMVFTGHATETAVDDQSVEVTVHRGTG